MTMKVTELSDEHLRELFRVGISGDIYGAGIRREDDRVTVFGGPSLSQQRSFTLKNDLTLSLGLGTTVNVLVFTDKLREFLGDSSNPNIPKPALKPFNLEAAQAGAKVMLADGSEVKIGAINDDAEGVNAIVGWYKSGNGRWVAGFWQKDGSNGISLHQLYITTEAKTGWVNIYPPTKTSPKGSVGRTVHESKEYALNEADRDVIDTIQIQWKA